MKSYGSFVRSSNGRNFPWSGALRLTVESPLPHFQRPFWRIYNFSLKRWFLPSHLLTFTSNFLVLCGVLIVPLVRILIPIMCIGQKVKVPSIGYKHQTSFSSQHWFLTYFHLFDCILSNMTTYATFLIALGFCHIFHGIWSNSLPSWLISISTWHVKVKFWRKNLPDSCATSHDWCSVKYNPQVFSVTYNFLPFLGHINYFIHYHEIDLLLETIFYLIRSLYWK